jgi:hypothetical protein
VFLLTIFVFIPSYKYTGVYLYLSILRIVKKANARQAVRHAIRVMWKKLKSTSDGGKSGSKKLKRGYSGAYGGIWRSLRLAGVWILDSGGRFCVGPFGRNLAAVAVKMFSQLIYFMKKIYKLCTFNAICKDDAEINCVTVQHKMVYSRQFSRVILR